MIFLGFFIFALNYFLTYTIILFPPNVNVGKFKPTLLDPIGSTCGSEQKGILFIYNCIKIYKL